MAASGMFLAMVLAAAAVPDAGWRPGQFPGAAGIEARIVALSNAARAEAGLRPLEPDERLRTAARAHSGEMQARGYFSHTSPVGSHATPRDRAWIAGFAWLDLGENIFAAEGLDVRDEARAARLAVDGWLSSPSHRANLLTPDFTAIGVGVTVKGRGFHATQVLGREVPDPYSGR